MHPSLLEKANWNVEVVAAECGDGPLVTENLFYFIGSN